jgi:Cu-processing system ATP-binding protein
MRQRLGLAQALLGRPRLLLLDEPTVGLDPVAVREFYTMLDDLRRQGTTVILSSHVLPGIEQHIDRVAMLREGALQAYGTLDELRRQTGLPLKIRASGRWPHGFWQQRLAERGIAHKVNGTHLEIETRSESQLDVMRLLLSDESIQNLDVHPPSLESLYIHFNSPDVRGADHA